MRGNEERERRSSHRACDAAVRERPADRARDVGIGGKLAEA